MDIRFYPIASGSSGNCIYIGNESTNILIDAGISGKEAENGLRLAGVSPEKIDAIFITHEHSDHIMGAGVLSRRYDIPIYATEKVWNVFDSKNMIGNIKEHNKIFIYKYENCFVNDIVVKPFEIFHDAIEPVGYNIFTNNRKITIATDIGKASDDLKESISDSDILLIESNHDIDMLIKGSYPWPLKKRILGDYGHLSNVSCGELITEIMSSKLKHIYLGHLSQENNVPMLAFETVKDILIKNNIEIGKDVTLSLAARKTFDSALPLIV